MPGHVGHMQQPVYSAQIDKRAEIGDAANGAAQHRACLQLPEFLLARPCLFLFQDHAAIHHHVFARRVQLDDPALDLLAHQLFHLRLILGPAARGRQERRQADVHAQSALYQFGDHAADGALLGECPLQRAPILGTLHLDRGKCVGAFLIPPRDAHPQLVTHFHRQERRPGRETAPPAARHPTCVRCRRIPIRARWKPLCLPVASLLRPPW